MEREIEFRAFYGNKMHDHKEAMRILYNNSTENSLTPKCPIMQFTGLRDKKEVKVFEGDIVRFIEYIEKDNYQRESLGVIRYDSDDCRFFIDNENDGFPCGFQFMRDIEVIGNIFQTPELLNS